MGYAHKEWIEKAGEWLLKKLKGENPIRYSQIWNFSQADKLEKDGEFLGIPPYVSFALMIDCAVDQLSDQGILNRKDLPDEALLDDGNIDYEIFFNWQKLDTSPHYVGMDL
jgi:hypothetical protein